MKELKSSRRGRASDELILKTIREHNGLSQYEIGKKMKWPSGRVDGSIRRLLNENKIIIRTLERNGRRVNLVYLKENKSSSIIEVPIKLLQIGNPTWQNTAFAYAIDSTTIGIAGHEMPEWNEIACFTEKLLIQKGKEQIILEIPEKFKRFYNLEHKHRVVSLNGNNILITISGNIIEQKKYPS